MQIYINSSYVAYMGSEGPPHKIGRMKLSQKAYL